MRTKAAFISLTIGFILMILVNACLISDNLQYKSRNRELILVNDSILSVNMRLIQEIQGDTKQTSVGLREP